MPYYKIEPELEPVPEEFYKEVLTYLNEKQMNYLVGGGYAFRKYSTIVRDTKDLDVFCKTSDYPKILKLFEEIGYESEITDARWVAKTKKGDEHIDIIFNTVNGLCAVDNFWFERGTSDELFGVKVNYVGPEEMIWCKLYICDRYRFDGADIAHIILKQGPSLDWKWLLHRAEQHWDLLFAQILHFQFVYPADRDCVPSWVMEELLQRTSHQMSLPMPQDKVCRGPYISQTQYEVAITQWGYKAVTYGTI